MDTTYSVTAQQDALRPLRMFVGALSGAMLGADQTNASQDMGVWSLPPSYSGYQTIGPYSYSAEGRPISAAPNGAIVISPMLVMIAIGAAAVYLARS